jgi:DNA polymerase-1
MTTLLVDGNNLLARADFAAKGKQVAMSADGVNTAALVIFINMLSRYVRMVKPERIRVCWDAGHQMRDDLYSGYKASRKQHIDGSPDTVPFAQAKEFLTWAGVSHSWVGGWEADDLIAVHVRQARGEVVILSSDKDLLQLVGKTWHDVRGGLPESWRGVTQIRPPGDIVWGEFHVEEKFGVLPHLLPYYLALVGDPGDGVPGLRGVGPKKACKMLSEAEGDWEALLATLEPEKAEEAALMLSLVDLRYIEYPWQVTAACPQPEPFRPTDPNMMAWDDLSRFCERYELASIYDRLLDGTLWCDPIKPSTDGVFDGLDDLSENSQPQTG